MGLETQWGTRVMYFRLVGTRAHRAMQNSHTASPSPLSPLAWPPLSLKSTGIRVSFQRESHNEYFSIGAAEPVVMSRARTRTGHSSKAPPR